MSIIKGIVGFCILMIGGVIGAAAVLGEPPMPKTIWPEGEEVRILGVQAKIRDANPQGWVGKKFPYDIPLLDRPNGELFSPSQDAQNVYRIEVSGSFN